MHGFTNGFSFLKSVCCDYDDILLQENWLSTVNLHKLGSIHDDFAFYGLSSMDDKISKDILSGRPFGGTAILYHKKFSNNIKLLILNLKM